MGPIQRYPQGLLELLSIKGVAAPSNLSETIVPFLDAVAFYELTQLQTQTANNAALAVGGNVTLTVPDDVWWLLVGAHATVLRTATVTSLRVSIGIGPFGVQNESIVAAGDLGPYGATVAGTCRLPFVPPRMRLLPPKSTVRTRLESLGTDATANVSINAQVTVLS